MSGKCQVKGESKFKSSNFQSIINITLYNKGKFPWPEGTRIISEKGVITFHEMIINNQIEPNDYISLQLICSLNEILEKTDYLISGIIIYEGSKLGYFSHSFEISDEIIHKSYSYVRHPKEDNELAIKNWKKEKEELLNKIKNLEKEKKELQKNYDQKVQVVNNLTNCLKEKSLTNSNIKEGQNINSKVSSISNQPELVKNEYQEEMKGSIKIEIDNNEKNKANKENEKENSNNKPDYREMIKNQNIVSEAEVYGLIDQLDRKYNAKTLFEMDELVDAIIKGKGKMGVIEDFLFE